MVVFVVAPAGGSSSVTRLALVWDTVAISMLVSHEVTVFALAGTLFFRMILITYGAKTFVLVFCVDLPLVAGARS